MKRSAILAHTSRSLGFTLPEVLVAASVSSIIVSVCLGSFVGLQRFHAVCLSRSETRIEVIRMFDAMEMDLRNARSVTAAVSGNENILPLTTTVPQRYTTYETTGAASGEPGRTAGRIQPTVTAGTGKLRVAADATIRYEAVASGASAQNINRVVAWTEGGVTRTATRTIATVPIGTTVRFRSSGSTSALPSPITSGDLGLVAKVSAPPSASSSAAPASITMESTIFLRRKSLK